MSEQIIKGKNKSLTQKLEAQELMTDFGRGKIEIVKQNGNWDTPKGERMKNKK